MSPDLFHEAFFFFTRREAEKLRLVCRHFNALCNGLRDVHGYKLQIYQISISCADEWTEPAEYFAIVWAYGQEHQIQGSEDELAAGVKAALSVSLVEYVYVYNSALNESLCGETAAFFAGVSAEIVQFADNEDYRSAYYEAVPSSKIWNLLLSFDAIGELQLYTDLLEEDLADEFILRCRAKRIGTLKVYADDVLLLEGSEDELLQRFRAVKPSLVSATR
ncbi:hypothetical protein AAVH_24277 [Aphelenchoides avenae]|nr:hypothetical protein AAVH_24277 [Aphelenchus avenae]